MKRPTLALACILKNEMKNIPRLLESVRDCFDEIHLTDTGSTDGSLELINSYVGGANPANSKVFVHEFQWCEDFAKARNASFEPIKTDFVMWMDLDDVLHNREGFIGWRNHAMNLADYWMATYHYAQDANGKPMCSFARERVFRRSLGFDWKYFIHEGVFPKGNIQYAVTWDIRHMRDAEDLKADRSRNLKIFEKRKGELDPRMRYYYGKELYENQKPLEAFSELMAAISADGLELHDRIMGLQYSCLCAMSLNQFEKAVQLAHQGLQLAPTRAEFFVTIADCYLKSGKVCESVPFYHSAANCAYGGGNAIQGPVFAHEDSYKHYPLNQLARIYANMGNLDAADEAVNRALKYGPNTDSIGIAKDLQDIRRKTSFGGPARKDVDAIVITCPPGGLYEWDEAIYRERGIGGSETAAVEMARHLSDLTGRRVIIFSGEKHKKFGMVEHRPTTEVPEFLRDNRPAAHIAWRHVTKLSDDPMWVWCHDLHAPGLENANGYHKVLALSEFHREFLENMVGVPKEKIRVTRNGIDPKRFLGPRPEKIPGKVVFTSSPDRGLLNAIRVMERVVKEVPSATLHVYYGFDNMLKMGRQAEVEEIQKAMAGKDWLVFHGNIMQSELTKQLQTACIWLYPTNFLETFCISAIEALCAGVYPIVRHWGALPHTLSDAFINGMADVIDHDCETEEGVGIYAASVFSALASKAWKGVKVDPHAFSWKSVAEEWIEMLDLKTGEQCPRPALSSSM